MCPIVDLVAKKQMQKTSGFAIRASRLFVNHGILDYGDILEMSSALW